MRSSNTSSRFERSFLACAARPAVVALGAVAVAACSSSSAQASAPTCSVAVSGSFAEEQDMATSCATMAPAPGDATHWGLTLNVRTPRIAEAYVFVDLGPAPVAGTISSETASSWALLAADGPQIDSGAAAASYADGGSTSCAYVAGTNAVPTGSFSLDLASVDTKSGAAHGSIAVEAHVHAPPGADCGPGTVETFRVVF